MSRRATRGRGRAQPLATLVGRGEELARLAETWRSVREGEGPAGVLVDGPAGVGKSRLVEQAGQDLLEPGDVLMVGHCVDLYGDEMPYGGASDAVRDLIRRHGVEAVRGWAGPYASALAALIPELDPDVTEVAPSRLLEGFAALLEGVCRDHPVWLWIEDLHWSDRATRALVSWVMRTVAAPRLMVTCTLRTQEAVTSPAGSDFWTELRRLPHVDGLRLLPFDRDEVAAHWWALSGSRPSVRTVRRVAELSGGLPSCAAWYRLDDHNPSVLRPRGDEQNAETRAWVLECFS